MSWLALALHTAGLPILDDQWHAHLSDDATSSIVPVPAVADPALAGPAPAVADPAAVDIVNGWTKTQLFRWATMLKTKWEHLY